MACDRYQGLSEKKKRKCASNRYCNMSEEEK